LKNPVPTHLSIRVKLILPYVLLSLLIALGGGIIITRMVIDSVEDRFTNQPNVTPDPCCIDPKI